MLKKILFAIVPVFLFTVALRADDSLGLNLADIRDADVSIIDESFDIDVDKLAENAGTDNEAVEACFRSFGYRGGGYGGYRGYSNYGCYGGGYGGGYGYRYNCYRPYYTCYRPAYYAPVCYTPCYTSYWGCY